MLRIRQMSPDDLDFAVGLTRTEGWSSTKRDFIELLQYDPMSSFIGEINEKSAAMVCTASYGDFGFIGNLIVQEPWRGQQIGRALMEHAMFSLRERGAQSILIDAVPRAESFYARLGFRRICRSFRLEGMITGSDVPSVRAMNQKDLPKVSALDANLFGGVRQRLLSMRYEAYPQYARVFEDDETIKGYIMGSERLNAVLLGPWAIANHHEDAEHLLLSFAQAVQGETMKVGVLEKNKSALDLLHRHGFERVSFSWRMIWGEDKEATISDGLYAIYSADRG